MKKGKWRAGVKLINSGMKFWDLCQDSPVNHLFVGFVNGISLNGNEMFEIKPIGLLLFLATLASCGQSPTNEENSKLLKNYLINSPVYTEGHLELIDSKCNDMSITDNELIASCTVTVRAIKEGGWETTSAVGRLYGKIPQGEVATIETEYVFQKFESGWKVRGRKGWHTMFPGEY